MNVQMQRNETRKLLSHKFNNHSGSVKVNMNNTFTHELAKFLLCWEAGKMGKEFVTEAVFQNGKRADILVLDDCEAWEVLHSETKEQFKSKQESYPIDTIRPFNAEEVIEKNLPMYLKQK